MNAYQPPAVDTATQPKQGLPTGPALAGELEAVAKTINSVIDKVAEVVERGSIKYLQILGGALVVIGSVARILACGLPVFVFSQVDLAVFLGTGLLILTGATAFKVYEYRQLMEWAKEGRRMTQAAAAEVGPTVG